MLQAVIRHITLIDSGAENAEIEKYRPADPLKFSIDLEVFVGIGGRDGSERFDIEACTPSWIIEELRENDCVIGHGKIIVGIYSYEKIIGYIESYIKMCKGRNVDDVYRRVGLLGDWESEWEI